MTHFLNPELFDIDALQPIFQEIVKIFISTYPEQKGLHKLLDQLSLETVDYFSWIKAVLTEEVELIVR